MSQPTKRIKLTQSTTIDDLPPELIRELFKYLHLKDLAACSLVNKRFYSIYSDFKLQSLVVYENFDIEISKWSHPDREIENRELVRFRMFNRLQEKPLISSLKRLAIFDPSQTSNSNQSPLKFDMNKLNAFSQLVHLEIHLNVLNSYVGRTILKLPKLRVLAFYNLRLHDIHHLFIVCPELSVLVCRGSRIGERLSVTYPETIRKLDTDISDSKLTSFKNLECLITTDFEVINKSTLLTLTKLKELHYDQSMNRAFGGLRNGGNPVGRAKRALKEFLHDAKLLRPNLKCTFAGFQITKASLDAIDFDSGVNHPNEYLYMRNWHLVDPVATLEFIHSLNYGYLMSYASYAPEAIPMCFYKKFTRVRDVSVSIRVEDPNHFLQFLGSLISLRKLTLDRSQLGREFYDQLPTVVPHLVELKVTETFMPQVGFEFTSRLPHLSSFEMHRKTGRRFVI